MNLGDKESQDWSHMNINLVFSKEYAPVKHTKTKNELFMIFTCLRTEIRIRNLKEEKKTTNTAGVSTIQDRYSTLCQTNFIDIRQQRILQHTARVQKTDNAESKKHNI